MPKQLIPLVRVVCGIMFALLSTLAVMVFAGGYHLHNGWIMAAAAVWMAFMVFVDVLFIRAVTLQQDTEYHKEEEDETKNH